jgi:uncharacterized repeat protein (TIGR03803 family)
VLYGSTSYGGSYDAGTLFKIDASGMFTSLHSFNGSDGAYPSAALVLGSDCALYGTTLEGSESAGGVVFRLFEPGHLCQHLRFDSLPDRTFGDPPFTVSATASSRLPVSWSAMGVCSLSGDRVSTSGGGRCTLTASQPGDSSYLPAADATQEFNVLFAFAGFQSPVENSPVPNRMKAGRAVPIRFGLGGDAGLDVIAQGYPVVQRVSCDTSAPLGEAERARSLGPTSLRYRPETDRYIYLWQTDKRWAGSCREFTLKLTDGTVHSASFSFTSPHRSHLHTSHHF